MNVDVVPECCSRTAVDRPIPRMNSVPSARRLTLVEADGRSDEARYARVLSDSAAA